MSTHPRSHLIALVVLGAVVFVFFAEMFVSVPQRRDGVREASGRDRPSALQRLRAVDQPGEGNSAKLTALQPQNWKAKPEVEYERFSLGISALF